MPISKDTLVRGYQFDGATGHKTGADLEDLTTRATLANGSELLDQDTLETFLCPTLAVYRARVKDASITAAKLATGLAVPTGAVMAFAMETAPAGWLECDGSAVSRTTYATLFAAIGTAFGAGDTSTTFNLPDMRGLIPRGWNHGKAAGKYDPDAATRTAQASGGATGDHVGTEQADGIAGHAHTSPSGETLPGKPAPYGYKANSTGSYGTDTDQGNRVGFYTAKDVIQSVDGTDTDVTKTETRPKNLALMYCIRT